MRRRNMRNVIVFPRALVALAAREAAFNAQVAMSLAARELSLPRRRQRRAVRAVHAVVLRAEGVAQRLARAAR